MPNALSILCCVVALVGASGASAAGPSVALHPSEVVDASAKEASRIHALIQRELAARGVSLAPAARVSGFLARRPDRSCASLADSERLRCLADLARAVKADRSLLITVAPYAGEKIVLTAQVVASDGALLQDVEPSTYPRRPKAARDADLRAALRDFLPKIELGTGPMSDLITPLTPAPDDASQPSPAPQPEAPGPAAVAPPPQPDALVAAPSPPPSSAYQARRTTGIIVGAAGIALAGAGTFFLISGNARAEEFNAFYDGGRPTISDEDRLAELRSSASQSQTLGVAGIGLGAAALATGAVLLFGAREPASPTAGNAQWLIGPGHVALRLQFP